MNLICYNVQVLDSYVTVASHFCGSCFPFRTILIEGEGANVH
jgi:hypothetical protein